jgi:hypothetical protein
MQTFFSTRQALEAMRSAERGRERRAPPDDGR